MRNYRPDFGKWMTADPLGYPDGWSQLAYSGNGVTMDVNTDVIGLVIINGADQKWKVTVTYE